MSSSNGNAEELQRLRSENQILRERCAELEQFRAYTCDMRYKSFLEQLSSGVAVFKVEDNGSRFIFTAYNAAAEAMDGRKRAEVIGRELRDVFPFVYSLGLVEMLERVWRTGTPDVLEAARINTSANAHSQNGYEADWRQNYVYKLPSDEIAVIFSDVSEKKKIEAELKNYRGLVQAMSDNMIDMLWAKDKDGRYLFANRAICENLLCCDDISPLGKTDVYFAQRQRELGWKHTFGELCVDSDAVVLEKLVPGRFIEDGLVRNEYLCLEVQKSPLFDGLGRLIGTVGTARDITRQREQEKALRESEHMLALTLEATDDGLWEYDPVSDDFTASVRWATMLGYKPVDIPEDGEQYMEWVHPDDRSKFLEFMQRIKCCENDTQTLQMRLRTAEGGWKWVYSRARVVERDSDHEARRILGANTDITELKKIQEDLTRAKEAAETATRSKSTFLANMSHEIRTPLNGILGMLQLLEQSALDGEASEYINIALSSGRSLLSIINDILDFSKMDAQSLSINKQLFSLHSVVHDVIETFRVSAMEKKLWLTVDLDASVPEVLVGDSARIRQILFNIVGNAIKFTSEGSVSLDVCVLPVHSADGSVRVLFCVQDTGIGIPPEGIPRMFQPFSQGEASFKRRYQGTGLGLAIVRNLVNLMGGTIAVDSQLGEGTLICCTIALELPVKSGARLPLLTEVSGEAPPMRLLLVEDEAVNRFTAKRMLESQGHEVVTAENGKKALAILDQYDVDCILMDVQMPEMDGLEATCRIRKGEVEGKQHVPIIALTAHAMKGDREHFLSMGMNGYLAKPIDFAEVSRVLNDVCSMGADNANGSCDSECP